MDMRGCFIQIFLLFSLFVHAAGDQRVIGGKAASLGFTSVAQADGWSVFNNQAGLAWCRRFSAGIYFENRFLLKELSLKAIGVTIPAGRGAFGISFQHFGFSLYSEMNAGIGYGLRLGKSFSAGVRIGWLRLHISDGFTDQNLVSVDVGLQFRASERLWMGLHAANPVPYKVSSISNEQLPTVIRLGLSWKMTGNLCSDIEVEKNLTQKPVLRAGIDYRPVKAFSIRIGFLSNPATFTFGAGIEAGNLEFDLASSYHMVLGYSPQASLIWSFGKTKNKK
ncbi:MAG: hypothetical protein NTU98_02285 [Bacteroidetes bacterium]|nr:hypothetical protein [Bacteroidota bacterium]